MTEPAPKPDDFLIVRLKASRRLPKPADQYTDTELEELVGEVVDEAAGFGDYGLELHDWHIVS